MANMVLSFLDFTPRPGALRYKDDSGEWRCANPHDITYSTVTMLATEYWTPDSGWIKIYNDVTEDSEGGHAD
jgi:hypothetical protein